MVRPVFYAGRASLIEAGSETSPRERVNEVSSSKEPAADTTSIVLIFHKEAAYIPPLHGPLCGFWWCCHNITVITPTDLSSDTDVSSNTGVLRTVENAMFNYFTKPGIYRSPDGFHTLVCFSTIERQTVTLGLFKGWLHLRFSLHVTTGDENEGATILRGPPSQFVSHCWEVS